MGSFKGLKQVRRIVEECMMNKMHPVYNIKVSGFNFCISFYVLDSSLRNLVSLADSHDEERAR